MSAPPPAAGQPAPTDARETATAAAPPAAAAPTTATATPAERSRSTPTRHDGTPATGVIAPVQAHDVAALSRFEIFLFSAVATVLIVRLFLAVTGYPQVGGDGLHVAHVLWGGLAMGIAIVMMLVGVGNRMRLRAAVIGGLGFGLFIDEVGKFLTKSVNYFFEPAVAIIYGVFVAFYLIVREVIARRRLTDARRNALGAAAVADQSLGELDEAHRAAALRLLEQVEVEADVAAALRTALQSQPTSPPKWESRFTRGRDRLTDYAARHLDHPRLRQVVVTLFTVGAIVVLLGTIFDVLTDTFTSSDGPQFTQLGALASSTAAAIATLIGVVFLMRSKRVEGFQTLQVAVLIDLLITDLFQFASIQFLALIGFVVQILALAVIRLGLRAEVLRATRGADTPTGGSAVSPAPAGTP